jgi:malate dehydrogenase
VAKETGFDRSRVLGMGSSLDSARLINLLSAASNLGVDSLEGFVFGLHNNEMIVSPQRIKIKGKTLDEYLDAQLLNSLKEHTAKRGGEIVGFLKNKSAHFAPGLAACSLIEAIVADANTVIPVSVLLNGEYGLKDVCVGVPCVINKKGAEKIIELKLDKEEQQKLEKAKKEFAEINSLELR